MDISLIVAAGKNNEIGYQNKLLWNIKEDMKWFRYHTGRKPIVMGRKTYESIGKPLKGRLNIVLSRQEGYQPHPDVWVTDSIDDILYELRNEPEVMVIGGETIYQQFMDYATRIYITKVDKAYTADAFFPDWAEKDWIKCYTRIGDSSTEELPFSFNVYKRKLK